MSIPIKMVDETTIKRSTRCARCGGMISKGENIVVIHRKDGKDHYCRMCSMDVLLRERSRLFEIETVVFGLDG